MSEVKHTLTKLYPSVSIRAIIWEKLKEVFKIKFEGLIKEATATRPFLVCPAKYFEEEIKHFFIEEGQQLDCIEDLEFVLYRLNFLKFPDYRKAKENFDQAIEAEEVIEKKSQI